jgi:two-component system, cell cycle response regulator DivK
LQWANTAGSGAEATSEEARLKTVLIVEDSAAGREMYGQALEACGYRVVQADDGAAAVRLATAEPPDVVIMNLSIPLVSGVDAIEILKCHPATEHVPVLVLTGHTSHNIREEAWEAGCDEYFDKPLPPTQLIEAVESRIGPGR